MKNKVPFIKNPDDECVPATIGMIIKYFEPKTMLSRQDLHKMCGYVKGMGSWQIKHMLEMATRGYQTIWIEDFDWQKFINTPKAYLEQIIKDPDVLEYQLSKTDLPLEANRMKQYLDKGYSFQQRPGTLHEIRDFLNEGWLVRLEVNACPLRGTKGYIGHSILVIGYEKDDFIIHNPDGPHHNMPDQRVSSPLLRQAWKEFGGSFSLYAFRKK